MATALKLPAAYLNDYEGTVIFQLREGQNRNALYKQICQAYSEHPKIEQDEEGNVYLMPPGGGESGLQDLAAAAQLYAWALRKKHGEAFGPTTTFKFPSGALKVPDAAWASNERIYRIPYQQRVERILVVPEFVIEIFSKTDRYDKLQKKMEWYIQNGVELGWLIHPKLREVLIYTPLEKGKLKNVDKIRGAGPVKGFILDLRPIWRGLRREGE